jgi:hypothetical protein
LLAPVWELLESPTPAAERASAAIETLNLLFDDTRNRVPAYLAALAATPHSPELHAGLADLWDELHRRLAVDITAQRAVGLLPTWVEPAAMASLILAVVNGVIVSSVIDPDGPDHRAMAGQFLALLLAAARPTAAHRSPPGATT